MDTNICLLSINDKQIVAPYTYTILQACSLQGIDLPRFCYHNKLSIAGNCRMCLVHLVQSIKPIVGCGYTIDNYLSVYTNTYLVHKMRESVLEFLLINHPIDCPICDQGGECDLQDQSILFGNNRSRYFYPKRYVLDKQFGPFVKTVMNRCIHCTRCVRFSEEVSKNGMIGLIGRGNSMEISLFTEKLIFSEFSGNLVDICPVGALISKPYTYKARP
jgi:NADH dehydrogenase/NADH:ubiquinone oxidoreductase subunit G